MFTKLIYKALVILDLYRNTMSMLNYSHQREAGKSLRAVNSETDIMYFPV